VIDGIVVNEGGEVDRLDDRGEQQGVAVRPVTDLVGQEQEGGPKQLPALEQQVVVDLLDELEIVDNEAADDLVELIQPATHRILDPTQFA
jgi:hypothetical protein